MDYVQIINRGSNTFLISIVDDKKEILYLRENHSIKVPMRSERPMEISVYRYAKRSGHPVIIFWERREFLKPGVLLLN